MTHSPPWHELSLEGELLLGEHVRSRYSEDASIHRCMPAAVACPAHRGDLATIVNFARRHGVSLHGWGAGTSRGGQPLGTGLVVDFRRHWRRIGHFNPASGVVSVEPGVLYGELQKFLREHGRSFPPDPSYHQCTIGGMVANNAAGIHSVKYGGAADYIESLEFLTSDGAWHRTDEPDALAAAVANFLREHHDVIRADYPKVEKNSTGYALDRGLRPDGTADLGRLLTGSEGTLGFITELRLRTVPLPGGSALATLYFPSLEASLQAAMDLRSYDVAACELVDKILLDLHHHHTEGPAAPQHAKRMAANPFLELFYRSDSQAVLVVEMEGDSAEAARAALEAACGGIPTTPTECRYASDASEAAAMWELRRHTSPILNRLEDGKISIKPLWAVEDVSLPRHSFIPYVKEQRELFRRHGLNCSFFGHAASCNLHLDPVESDPRQARQSAAVAALYDLVAAESFALCVRHGGSISGEHGDGLTRTAFLPIQYPRAHALFAPFKALFDPAGLFNPGKIAANPLGPAPAARPAAQISPEETHA